MLLNQQKKNEDKIFTFPKVSSVFHEEPHANSDYSSRLIDAIDVLDKALCKGWLNLMAEYYPFDDDPAETKNCISADYPYTSVLVNEYPQFYTIIQKHLEINDLVTMKTRISLPNLNIKSQTQKAADFIHLSINALLSCDKHINSEKLKELDSKFIKMLSDNIMDVDSCNVYLKNNQSRKKLMLSVKKSVKNLISFPLNCKLRYYNWYNWKKKIDMSQLTLILNIIIIFAD